MQTDSFVFKKQDKIGVADANDDVLTLMECFVDTGDYDIITDFRRNEKFITGRTGAGKTALITKLNQENQNVIIINPEDLALRYVSNSNIIMSLEEAGLSLDIFYKLLWRHVLVIEILKFHFDRDEDTLRSSVFERFKKKHSKNSSRSKALTYLQKWESSFWQDTEDRVTEFTRKTESDIQGSIASHNPALATKLQTGQKLSEEEKHEIKRLSQDIISTVQLKALTEIISIVDELFEDEQKEYYLVIDRLDDEWVGETLRYKLIKALLQTIRDLNPIHQVKPLVLLRVDLISRVYQLTRDQSFQEEKFTSLTLPIRWTERQLIDLLNKRIDTLVKSRYTKRTVTYEDILPEKIGDEAAIKYILSRTHMRPRDVIHFFNNCIYEATDSPIIAKEMILRAEKTYSKERLDGILYEWSGEYPHLNEWLYIIEGKDPAFEVGDLQYEDFKQRANAYHANHVKEQNDGRIDSLFALCEELVLEQIDEVHVRKELVCVLYKVGIVGLSIYDDPGPIWSHEDTQRITIDDIDADTLVYVHPSMWPALRINKIAID